MKPDNVPKLGPPPIASSQAVHKSMKANRGRDTAPEIRLRKALWSSGLKGYRLTWRNVPGRPDIAYPGRHIAVFVHGCFWHRCPYCKPTLPKANADFWQRKFTRNKERDLRKKQELEAIGWHVVEIWECEIKKDIDNCVNKIKNIWMPAP